MHNHLAHLVAHPHINRL